jgi:transcriptional regulator with XRE-family HTH domain
MSAVPDTEGQPDREGRPDTNGPGPSGNGAGGSGADRGWSEQINALGGFIRAQRQLAKLSLREMAAMTRVSNAYLSQVERGLHQPSLKVLHSIADALQLSTEQLLAQAGWMTGTREGRGAGEPAAEPPSAGETEQAISRDPRLSPEQRAALLGVYRSFVDAG